MHILALHGFTGRGTDFAPFAERVGSEWHCPDLPGHGPDPRLDCTPEATLGFVEAERATCHSQRSTFSVQRSTFSVQGPRVLLGYSMGARAALQHAVAHPAAWDALILISPHPGIEDPAERAARRASDETLADRIERGGVAAFLEFWQQTPMIRSQRQIHPDWRKAMQTARAGHSARGLAASLRQFGQGACPHLWPEWSRLALPTLLITGQNDRKYTDVAIRMSSQRAASDVPSPIHVAIDDVHHMPHLEAPEASAEVSAELRLANLRSCLPSLEERRWEQGRRCWASSAAPL
jgi:2-succinyl-6-hydroxy-2,4-cyclohexadiene-1-carboxylate synthase